MNGAGQPALLYLVPCTLGTVLVLGFFRKELLILWDGGKDEDADVEKAFRQRGTDSGNEGTSSIESFPKVV
ncbi:hypothetical protein CBR_g47162 [Chara braunii]|uniref:Uncharacterized protein n=1 Tax=Chara braunii TaxID=69332 RepID=A0A388M1T3_CHABU|nr:hypothetical protein CBR_g47162 [Chara braunii]|eukprot:GBG88465.1 hypothetical protein CBR_g47162 [Chara braunii]